MTDTKHKQEYPECTCKIHGIRTTEDPLIVNPKSSQAVLKKGYGNVGYYRHSRGCPEHGDNDWKSKHGVDR